MNTCCEITGVDFVAMVLAFHQKFGCTVNALPALLPPAITVRRRSYIREEFLELCKAIDTDDLPEIADACADLIYVVIGCAIEHGINLRDVFRAVHEANLLKIPSATPLGKVRKPEGWQPPDIASVLARQEPIVGEPK